MKPATAADHWQNYLRASRYAKNANTQDERKHWLAEAERFQNLHFAVIERQINAIEVRRTLYP